MGLCKSVIVVVTLLIPLGAYAQDTPEALGLERRWDVSASGGLLRSHSWREAGEEADESNGTVAYAVDIGRYWTNHLKAEVGITLAIPEAKTLDTEERFPAPGYPLNGGYDFGWVDTTYRFVAVSAGGTYQFFENSFAHPFIATGLRLGWLNEHRFREAGPGVSFINGRLGFTDYTLPAIDERNTSLSVMPFVAGGFKAYFNERVFVRPEGLAALGANGVTHLIFRLGVGADF